jgi:hypothetical protein
MSTPERDILKEAQEWYLKHTRLVPADFLDRSMGQPEYLYVGYLLEVIRGLSERLRELEKK